MPICVHHAIVVEDVVGCDELPLDLEWHRWLFASLHTWGNGMLLAVCAVCAVAERGGGTYLLQVNHFGFLFM